MKNISFAIIFVFVFSVFSFGQADNLQNDLKNSFKKFNLIKFGDKATRRKTAVSGRLSIPLAEKNFELLLTPRDLRSASYRAEDTGVSGISRLERDEVTTFKGKVSGDDDSQVRMSVNGARIEGYFTSGGEMFVVEAAQKYSRAAAENDYVVYRADDLINQESSFCETSVAEKITQGKRMLAADGVQTPLAFKVVEMATEADFEFVNALGGASQANREILDILNMVEGVYERELNLTINVTYQHTWTVQDPFASTDTLATLNSFRDYWNVNFPVAQNPRDAAHLFSGKPTIAGQGLAYIGVVCRSPANAYSFSGRINVAPIKFMLPAHEIGHNFGARHAEALQTSGNTLMNGLLTSATQFSFSAYSRTEISTFVSANNLCLTDQEVARTKFDFNGDGKSDISVFRPSDGKWYLLTSAGYTVTNFGAAGDIPVAGDYDGDGKSDIAVFRPSDGKWYLLTSAGYSVVSFGTNGDVPVAADYNGDGKTDIAVFRPSDGKWYLLTSAGFTVVSFGAAGDIPVAGDYNGDGKSDIAVFRPSNGNWYLLTSAGYTVTNFGAAGDVPVVADYNSDGKSDISVFRPSDGKWYLLTSAGYTVTSFGTNGDIPVAADYNGDGKSDIAVFRPSNGAWYLLTSAGYTVTNFGASGDTPVPNALIR